jgi:N-methylhydantoinase A
MCSDGRIFLQKVLTRIDNPWKSISMGIKSVMDSCGEREGVIFHASTIATNMLLGQRGRETARSALLITSGFKDLLVIARQNRPRLYDPFFKKPRQLVPDELIYEVNERTLHSGEVVEKVDEHEVESYLKDAVAKGAESVAVVFINSYANPLNEDTAASIASKYFRFVIESSRASPSPREYERGSTAVVNAVLMPKVHEYLSRLWDELQDMGFANLYVMSSSGGLLEWEDAARSPSRIVESGPAAGVVGASILASLLGIEKAIAFDMGGTTAKASSIINGVALLTNEYEVGGESHHGRLVKGSGYPVRGSFIDLAEVSAGGGTVIWRDKAGAICVGPHSVGSMPGPMCYETPVFL